MGYGVSMSHSTIEISANRNGLPVRVKVRDLTELGTADGHTIAPPRNGRLEDSVLLREEIVDLMLDALKESNHGYASLRSTGSLMSWRDELSDATLEAYRNAIRARPKDGFADLLLGIFNTGADDSTASYCLEIAKLDPEQDYANKSEDNQWGKGDKAHLWARSILNGLSWYGGIGFTPPPYIRSRNHPDVPRTLGLVRFIHLLRSGNDGTGLKSFYPPDDEPMSMVTYVLKTEDSLARLVLDHPNEADRIADLVLTMETTDADLLRDIISAPVPALCDGVL
jgi:hypothetical protein